MLRQFAVLVLFVALTMAAGAGVGILTAPGEWYAALNKPAFNPPNWIFGPVWSALYLMIGVAGWRIWRAKGAGLAMALWWVQLALNLAWSPVFFGMQQPLAALGVLAAMLAAIIAFMAVARRADAFAFWLFAPYAVWVIFAGVLNTSIVILN
ncbi:MAG: tryptophan-rich sensory protein [Maricaulaceae bacterium]|nr:tryptophan-rich sensory protein [Maricaulaceae bacterium]